MSRRATGWALLAFAVAAALAVLLLGRHDGGIDGWLALTAVGGVLFGVAVVLLDVRHARRRRQQAAEDTAPARLH